MLIVALDRGVRVRWDPVRGAGFVELFHTALTFVTEDASFHAG